MEIEKTTLVDADAEFEGKLTGKDARILGRFKGEVQLSGRLQLGEAARVEARVKADAVEIAGEYKGDLTARSLVLLERARVSGTVDAQTLAVREGAQLNGSVAAGDAAKRGATPAPPPKPATGAVAG